MPQLELSKLEYLFATPTMIHRWEGSDELNEQLKSVILQQERTGPSNQKSNVGGWQSTDDFGAWAGEPGKMIIERMMAMTNHATRLLFTQFGTGGQFGWKFAIWANVNRRGEFNKMHFHPGSTWSGVYYVDNGGADAQDRVSGSLNLHEPRTSGGDEFFCNATPAVSCNRTGARHDGLVSKLCATCGSSSQREPAAHLNCVQCAQRPLSMTRNSD